MPWPAPRPNSPARTPATSLRTLAERAGWRQRRAHLRARRLCRRDEGLDARWRQPIPSRRRRIIRLKRRPRWPASAATGWKSGRGPRSPIWPAPPRPRPRGSRDGEVALYPMPVGDGSGSAFDLESITIAVELAEHARRPVSLAFPPATAQNQDAVRPPMLARMAALPGADGAIAAWSARIAGASAWRHALARAGGESHRRASSRRGQRRPTHSLTSGSTRSMRGLPIRTGYMRGGEEAMLTFATESFVDEMARALGAEPLAFRIGMLGGAPRLASAIMTAATIGGWDGGAPGSTMGLACASLFGSHIGLLAEATHRRRPDGSRSRGWSPRSMPGGSSIRAWSGSRSRADCWPRLAGAVVPAPEYVAGMPRAAPMRRPRLRTAARRAEDRGRNHPERRRARRGQRTRHGRARPGRRQCDRRRHRQALAQPAVRPDERRMSARRPSPIAADGRRAADQPRHARRARAGRGAPLSRRIPVRSARGRNPASSSGSRSCTASSSAPARAKSAQAYRQVWTDEGSPLAAITAAPGGRACSERLGDDSRASIWRCATAIRRSAARSRKMVDGGCRAHPGRAALSAILRRDDGERDGRGVRRARLDALAAGDAHAAALLRRPALYRRAEGQSRSASWRRSISCPSGCC